LKSSDVHIRRLTRSDATAYRELRLRAFREHPEAFTSDFETEAKKPLAAAEQRLSSAPESKFWGAFSERPQAILIGMVGLDRETRVKNRHKATVVGMYVTPEHAKQGIAQGLLTALITEARASGVELLVLTFTSVNQHVENLYRRAGFMTFGLEPGAIKVDNHAFDKTHMYLQLESS
jgi:GNAT superfamily N-acetyltransferase